MRLCFLLLALMAIGCELPGTSEEADTPAPTPATGTPTTPAAPVANSTAQAEWDAIQWHTAKGPACPGAVEVMSLTAVIFDNGSKIRFEYSNYPWSGNGIVHFFVWNGTTWQGGKFDNIRYPGQAVKLTENILAGYNDLPTPASGSTVAFAWTDSSGGQRSNLAKTIWP